MTASIVPSAHAFTPEQEAELIACAIPPSEAAALGIRSARSMDDLPDYAKSYVDGDREILPAFVYPWTSAAGRSVEQVKPYKPVLDADGHPMKYLWPASTPPVIHAAKDPAEPSVCFVVEGTKQSRAAALYAADDVRVVGLGGCYNWMVDGITSPELEDAMEDLDVVVCFDADMWSNSAVFEAATRIERAAKQAGAKSVRFVRLATGSAAATSGLDDYLGGRDLAKRPARLASMIANAEPLKKGDKPKSKAEPAGMVDGTGRPIVDITQDAWTATVEMHKHLVAKWDGHTVFNYGNVLTKLATDADGLTVTEPMLGPNVDSLIHATCRIVNDEGAPLLIKPALREMVRAEFRRWTYLAGVVRNPFVRPDGSVCVTSGYDPETRYLVTLSEDMEGLPVPEDPEPEQVQAAVKLLMDEWLGDFPFHTEADRANALAFVLTPFIRGSVGRVPMAVIDGLQMGVGKGVFVDAVYMMLHGRATAPTPWSDNEEEQRKVITALFRSGTDLFVYDEAHSITGRPLAQAITAASWTDRKLGVSDMVEFPNNVTWACMGNNVQVHDDMRRRVYRIRIEPKDGDPDRRKASEFRHPRLSEWTQANRAELIKACLTIVRSWYSNGGRETTVSDFGSFESWQATVGSILDNARVEGFLTNMRSWLNNGDSSFSQWVRHYEWLLETYPDETEFMAADVARELTKMLITGSDEKFPPNLEPGKDGKVSARRVGQQYGYQKGKIVSGMRLTRRSDAINRWHIERIDEDGPDPSAPDTTVTDPPAPTEPAEFVEVRTDLSPVVFDLETNGLGVYSEPDFPRIVGFTDGPDITVTTDHAPVVRAVQDGSPLVAHNGFQFDFHSLAHQHGMDLLDASERGLLWDTKVMAALADPPPFDMKIEHVEKHYSLNNVAERLGVPTKTDDLERLALEYGGHKKAFGAIPVDNTEYRDYCRGDVASTVEVFHALGAPTPYAMREFRLLGRLASSVTGTGFRVDTDLLERRLEENAAKAAEKKAWLDEHHPLPKLKADGSPAEKPQATKEGKAALLAAFRDLGANPDRWPDQGKTGPSLGKDNLLWLHELATEAGKLEIAALAQAVMELNGIRTVYQTVKDNMSDGRVHPTISARQASGRLSITDPGLTVFGKRGGKHVERAIFLPEPGHLIVAADLSQVDQRAVAALCQDKAYMAMFEPGRDSHTEVALAVWDDAGRRSDAKVIGHGWNYGASPRRLAMLKGVTIEAAMEFDTRMQESYPDLVMWKREIKALAETGELLDNGFGRKMRPDPARAYTQGPALMGQGAARDLMMDGILRLPLEVVPMMRAVVHDEVVFSIPEDIVTDVSIEIERAFTSEWRGVPILTDVSKPGRTWAEVYE
jgi:DNA polymerase-1